MNEPRWWAGQDAYAKGGMRKIADVLARIKYWSGAKARPTKLAPDIISRGACRFENM